MYDVRVNYLCFHKQDFSKLSFTKLMHVNQVTARILPVLDYT